ncbi:hypothetical protein IWW36_005751, partial [Coemansia brasiliensis]
AGQDRGVSIWLTSQPVPIAASTGLFTGSVFDLAWHSPENLDSDDDPVVARLAACSFDGTVALLEFTQSELGKPIPIADQGALLAAHGCTRPIKGARTLSELYASDNESIEYNMEDGNRHPQPIAETVEQMRLEARHQESREARIAHAIETVVAAPSAPTSQATELKQIEENPPKPQEAEAKQQPEPQAMPVPVRTKDGRKRVAPVFIRPLGRANSSTSNNAVANSQVKVSAGQPPAADPPRVPLDKPLWIEARVLITQNSTSKQNSENDSQVEGVACVSSLSTQSIAHAQPAAMPRVQLAMPQVVAQLESLDSPAISVIAYNQQERVRVTCMQNSWTAHLGGSACIALAASSKITAAGMLDGSVHWFDSSSGARLAPPLITESPVVVLRCTHQYCLWLNAVGQLTAFDTDAMCAVIEQTSIAPLLYTTDSKVPALTGI